VHARLEAEAGKPLAEAMKLCDEGANDADPVELVRRSGKLAAWLRGLP
jgi:hypothetical protein